MSVARPALLLALTLALAACGGEESAKKSPSAAECEPLSGAATTERMSPAVQNRDTMFLTDVSVETEDCVERVVFDFKSSEAVPGFEVSYKPADAAKTEDGSGNMLDIAGQSFLVVRIAPAMTAEIEGEDVKPTYTGPREIVPEDARFIREIEKTGDFEGVVTWAIGLDRERPFTTNASEDRLTVEIGP